MFAPIFLILSALFPAATLPNGIRLVEIPTQGDPVEIVAGYASGRLSGFASSPAVRSLALTVYAAGGNLDFFEDLERTGLRITVPPWAVGMFTDQLPALFKELRDGDRIPEVRNSVSVPQFPAQVEEEIRNALVGPRFQTEEYATDRAFVLFPAPVPDALRQNLAAIPNRGSKTQPENPISRLQAERTWRFKSDLPVGGVILAAPAPAVYYKEWYSMLMLDRVIHRTMPIKATSDLQLTIHPYYYRLEVPVPFGQFPEPVEENLLQELQRLQLTRVESRQLEAAREDAREYLEGKDVREWFESLGIPERREEGIDWIQAMTADDVRVAVRDLLIANRVIATWSPKARQVAVEVEDLGKDSGELRPSPGPSGRPLPEGEAGALTAIPFPMHQDPPQTANLAEKLASGVSLIASNVNAVFVSGGMLTRLEGEPDPQTVNSFQNYRADRILVLATPNSMDRARQIWSSFRGNNNGTTGVPKGDVSSGDLPALVIIKALLDRKLIEAGWWRDVELKIDASEGSTLTIAGDAERHARVIEWAKKLGSERPSDADMAWAREAAIHRFGSIQADLQALTWERDPQGVIQDLHTVSSGHVQDVARIYF